MPRLRVISLLVIFGSSSASAQLVEVQPGARVRAQAPGILGGTYVGTVLTRTADTLVLGSPTTAPVSVPIARLRSLEISRGNSRTSGAEQGMK